MLVVKKLTFLCIFYFSLLLLVSSELKGQSLAETIDFLNEKFHSYGLKTNDIEQTFYFGVNENNILIIGSMTRVYGSDIGGNFYLIDAKNIGSINRKNNKESIWFVINSRNTGFNTYPISGSQKAKDIDFSNPTFSRKIELILTKSIPDIEYDSLDKTFRHLIDLLGGDLIIGSRDN